MFEHASPILMQYKSRLDQRGFMDLWDTAKAAINSAAKWNKRGVLARIPLPNGTEIVAIKGFDGRVRELPAIKELSAWLDSADEVAEVLKDSMVGQDWSFVFEPEDNDDPFA